jgi:hypothetical protein
MKKIIVISIVFLLVSCGTTTPYETFREANKEEVALSFGVSSLVVNSLVCNKDFKKIREQISGIKKYHVLISKPNPTFIKSNFDVFLVQNNFQELFYTTKGQDKIRIFSLENGEELKEVLVEIENESEIVLVKIQGLQQLTAFNEVN